MTNQKDPGHKKEQDLDLSDFGNMAPLFSNRFHIFTGPIMSKIYFGEIMLFGAQI